MNLLATTFRDLPPYTMREAINAGEYYDIRIPAWQSGYYSLRASSPEMAALLVGCIFTVYGWNHLPAITSVYRHLPGSQIGAVIAENCGEFATAPVDNFSI